MVSGIGKAEGRAIDPGNTAMTWFPTALSVCPTNSATLAVILKELDPTLKIELYEVLDGPALSKPRADASSWPAPG